MSRGEEITVIKMTSVKSSERKLPWNSIDEFRMIYLLVVVKCGQWLQNETDCYGAKTAREYKIRLNEDVRGEYVRKLFTHSGRILYICDVYWTFLGEP